MSTIYVTEIGFHNLKKLLSRKTDEYAEVRQRRQMAFELSGDGWHDNPEFNREQQMEANLNHLVKELTEKIANAKLIEITEGRRPNDHVAIGSAIKIIRHNITNNLHSEECWEIVGYDETDIKNHKLGYNAPLAKAIIGLKAGEISDEVTIGKTVWEIEICELFSRRNF